MTSIDRRTTKLINAVKGNLISTARKVLKDGVDVNAVDGNMNTAIMFVKSVDMLNLLLENGANVNAKNRVLDSVLTVYVKRMDREKWKMTQFPALTPNEFLGLWDVIKRKGLDSTSVNIDNKKARYYLNVDDPAQRIIGVKICSHEGHIRIKQGAQKRAAETSKSAVEKQGNQGEGK